MNKKPWLKQTLITRRSEKQNYMGIGKDARYLPLNICRLCSGMNKFGGCSIRIAQIDDESKEKLTFRIRTNSTSSLLVSRSDMSNMRCFSIGGMKNQHDTILQSYGTTEEIIISLTRLPSTNYSPLPSSLLLLKI